MSTDADETINFETSLRKLEALVGKMESGELSLEESLSAFEHGVALSRRCQAALQAAELRVKALTQEGEEVDLSASSGDVEP